MDSVLRAASIYLFLLLIFRISGKRTLAQTTTFDFVLLLIIAESTQQGLLGDDFSVTNAFLIITTLVSMDIFMAFLKGHWKAADRVLDGLPLVLVAHGHPLIERLRQAQVDESEILAAARESQGLERLDQIKYAVLERSGGISIIPQQR